MPTIPRSYIDNLNKVVHALSDDAKDKIEKAVNAINATDEEDLKQKTIKAVELILEPYTDNAAAVAATFYDGLREWFGISDDFMAESENMHQIGTTAKAVNKYAAGESKVSSKFVRLVSSIAEYEISRVVNECIAYNAQIDPTRPKWARVPSVTSTVYKPWSKERGVTHNKALATTGTCSFCTMLASRGFAYQSRKTASHAHAGCDCRVVASWDLKNPALDGYDPEKLYDEWIESGFRVKSKKVTGRNGKITNKELGRKSKLFEDSGINGMRAYLEESKDLDDLYKRVNVVLSDINENWDGSQTMFKTASNVAKAMRDKLSG